MILNTTPKEKAEINGVEAVSAFKIKASAKAFDILSSGLYSDKHLAIVRELSCNAYDSHVAAGCPEKPFEIQLPNAINPIFRVRDYGTGLDHDEVVDVYTTYFESTKTDSNDFVGALGLGSKSPFSYTRNFTVNAYKDGTQRSYSVFISDEGVPSIALLKTLETDEPNGLGVQFQVNNSYDYHLFERALHSALKYFPVKPNVLGSDVTFEPNHSDSRMAIDEKNFIDSGKYGWVAVMGNIGYPVECDMVDANREFGMFFNEHLEMHFDIGEIDFQASREGLQYTDRTKRIINERLKHISKEFEKVIRKSLDDNCTDVKSASLYLLSNLKGNLYQGYIKKYLLQKGFRNMVYPISTVYVKKGDYLHYCSMSLTRETYRHEHGGIYDFLVESEIKADGYNIGCVNRKSCNKVQLSEAGFRVVNKVVIDRYKKYLQSGGDTEITLEEIENSDYSYERIWNTYHTAKTDIVIYNFEKNPTKYKKLARLHVSDANYKSGVVLLYTTRAKGVEKPNYRKLKEIFKHANSVTFIGNKELDEWAKDNDVLPDAVTNSTASYNKGIYLLRRTNQNTYTLEKSRDGQTVSDYLNGKKFYYYNTLRNRAEFELNGETHTYNPKEQHAMVERVLNEVVRNPTIVYANRNAVKRLKSNPNATDVAEAISGIMEKLGNISDADIEYAAAVKALKSALSLKDGENAEFIDELVHTLDSFKATLKDIEVVDESNVNLLNNKHVKRFIYCVATKSYKSTPFYKLDALIKKYTPLLEKEIYSKYPLCNLLRYTYNRGSITDIIEYIKAMNAYAREQNNN